MKQVTFGPHVSSVGCCLRQSTALGSTRSGELSSDGHTPQQEPDLLFGLPHGHGSAALPSTGGRVDVINQFSR